MYAKGNTTRCLKVHMNSNKLHFLLQTFIVVLSKPTMEVPPISFEYVGPNQIVTIERGRYVEDEILDKGMYNLYCLEKENAHRPDIQLIPAPFFRFLSSVGNSINEVTFDSHEWNTKMAPRLPPYVIEHMFNFQKEAVFKMVKIRRCLNASSMGLGKTLQGLAALRLLKSSDKGDVIFCPGYLRNNWFREVKLWLGEDYPVIMINKGDKHNREKSIKSMLFDKGLKIVSYDMAANFFAALKPQARDRAYFNTVICDESHFLKDIKSKRFTNLEKSIKHARNVLLLSGTPAPNRNKELFSQFQLLNPMVFDNIRSFTDRYCGGHIDKFGRYNDMNNTSTRELAFMSTKMILRLRREDHLSDLPKVMRHKIFISPSSHPTSFMRQMKQFRDQLKLVDEDKDAGQKLQRLASSMFTETALIKENPVMEYLESLCDSNVGNEMENKIILFVVHQSMFKAVSLFLTTKKEQFVAISGTTPMDTRPGLINTFLKTPEVKYAVLTIGSCSTGLNITPVSKMVFLELCWTPSELSQAEARINRINGAQNLTYTYVLCENTLDEMVFRKLERKNTNSVVVVDGGKDYGDFNFEDDNVTGNKRKKTNV